MKLSGYEKITVECEKCGKKTVVETDFFTKEQAKKLHTCEKKGKVKDEKGK